MYVFISVISVNKVCRVWKIKMRPVVSEYKTMWLFTMFDLPVDSKEARREYTQFRKTLLGEGFMMLQFSIYVRFCATEESAKKYHRRIKAALPHEGQVRILAVTDRQFGKMEVYFGKTRGKVEKAPTQLVLF